MKIIVILVIQRGNKERNTFSAFVIYNRLV